MRADLASFGEGMVKTTEITLDSLEFFHEWKGLEGIKDNVKIKEPSFFKLIVSSNQPTNSHLTINCGVAGRQDPEFLEERG